jgi:ribosomal protein S18 acetylase RimI-like enzyme
VLKSHIKIAKNNDAADLSTFARRVFLETFGAENTPDDMALYIEESFTPSCQGAEIRDQMRSTLLLRIEDKLMGYAQLSWGKGVPQLKAQNPVELVRFYIDQKFHGKGVADNLLNACLDLSRSQSADVMWLGVWEKNARALKFYRKHQFQPNGDQIFQLGHDQQRDIILARPL